MARKSAWILAAMLAVLSVDPVSAQDRPRPGAGQGGRSPVLMLATQKAVQEELKLGDEQISKVAGIEKAMKQKAEDITETDPKERMKKAMEIFGEAEKGVFAVLKPAQAKRLRQIALQQQGLVRAIESPTVAKDLKLSGEQTQKVRAIRESASKEISKLFEGAKSRDEARQKMADVTKTTEEKVLKVLTDEQKMKWQELRGEPFKGELKQGFGLREPREPRERKEPCQTPQLSRGINRVCVCKTGVPHPFPLFPQFSETP